MSRLGDWLRGQPRVNPAAVARVKDKVRLILGLPESVAVSVSEIVCADPTCPGMETVILVMQPGKKTVAFKVQASIESVSDEALTVAVLGDSRPQ